MGGVGGTWAPLGGLLVWVWGVGSGALAVPFPVTAGLPLSAPPPPRLLSGPPHPHRW